MEEVKKFSCLNVSSKFAICGLPIRVDTYKTCSFGCTYCFSNNRKIMEFDKELQIGDLKAVKRKLTKIFNKGDFDKSNFLDNLISQRITWHCGGMSDPFQPCESKYHVTRDLVELTKEFGITILFSTKSDTVHGAEIDNRLHSFQLSVSNTKDRRDIEPNIPSFESRVRFYHWLKDNGFRVGIRVQPFIPGVTDDDIVDVFKDADNFSIEGLKLVPQNKEHRDYLVKTLGLDTVEFTQMGLLNLKPEIRERLYVPMVEKIEKYGIPYSIADNDMHYKGTNRCCCGDRLVSKSTGFNNTALSKKYGFPYKREDVDKELMSSDVMECRCSALFTSNRTGGGRL